VVFPQVQASSLLTSPDVPVVSYAADDPSVAVALSAVKFPGAPSVAAVPALMSLLGAMAAAGMLATAQVLQQRGRQQWMPATVIIRRDASNSRHIRIFMDKQLSQGR